MNEFTDIRESSRLFRIARDRMIDGLHTYDWPRETEFNWAVDWFDQVSASERCAVIVVNDGTTQTATYGELRCASNRLGNWLRAKGVIPGDRMMVLMRNSVDYYVLSLALMKVGAVIVPCFTSIPPAQVAERFRQANARHLAIDESLLGELGGLNASGLRLISTSRLEHPPSGWVPLSSAQEFESELQDPWRGDPKFPLMGIFTSGTTSQPKLVLHSHQSYPVGHLSSLYWQGIGPSDCHANVSPPGWAKHAWSSMFVPFSAEATALVFNSERPSVQECLTALEVHGVTSFCAPPSFWKALVRYGLGNKPRFLVNAVSAGESLDTSLIHQVRSAWSIGVRDGYGQSEITALLGFAPGKKSIAGALGHPLPGDAVVKLIDPLTGLESNEGELCIDLAQRPISLMLGYADERGEPSVPTGQYYRTGDLARRDESGCYYLLGRTNDVFKSYDLRISPIELERILVEHPQVAEVAVFPIKDEFGELVPAAAVVPTSPTTESELLDLLIKWQMERAPQAHQIKRLWKLDCLPRTQSGKIRRAQLLDLAQNPSTVNAIR